ncbi:MAG TPA: ferritin-like domain-containing protein [Pseudonocardiaceae bacterium]|nr:ferritin-like domain-containing protein [Pseudonocardiaceae bacterium]
MPGPRPSRRHMLAAGAALLVIGPTGCTRSIQLAPEGADPLEAPSRRAETDSALAQAVALMAALTAVHVTVRTGPQTPPALATAARALAADRMTHAITLHAELRRVRPAPAPSAATPPAAPPLTDPDLAGARAALIQAVHAAQDEAIHLVLTLPGYRAALLASVAACCATHLALHDKETYRGHQTPFGRDMSPYRAQSVDAVQGALAAEHAAVWAYGLAGAFVPDESAGMLEEAATAHQARRDATERALIDAGARPVPAEPGYLSPEPVTDAASALRLMITAETDAAAAWRSVVERSPAEPGLRAAALDALIGASVWATRWRATADIVPLTVPFPGVP